MDNKVIEVSKVGTKGGYIDVEQATKCSAGETTLQELKKNCIKYAWSNVIYKENYRTKANFKHTDLMVLDIDDGLTIEQAKSCYKDYNFFIGTTKSHQVVKSKHGKPEKACDRYRMVFLLEHRIEDAATYEATWESLVAISGVSYQEADRAAIWWYQPCTEIVSENTGKNVMPVPFIAKSNNIIPNHLYEKIQSYITKENQDTYSMRCCLPEHPEKNPSAYLLKKDGSYHCSSHPTGKINLTSKSLMERLGVPTSDPKEVELLEKQFDNQIIYINDLLKEAEEDEKWIVEGLIPRESLVVLAGDSGAGKSWLVLDLLLAMSLDGCSWLNNFDTAKGKLLYVAFEDGKKAINRRLKYLLRGRNLSDQGVDLLINKLPLWSMPSVDLINKPAWQQAIINKIKENQIDVVVFDTFRKLAVGVDENSSMEIDIITTALLRIAREGKCAVLATHHVRKPQGTHTHNAVVAQKHDIRGSGALTGALDAQINISKIGSSENGVRVQIYNAKQRNAEDGQEYVFYRKIENKTCTWTLSEEANTMVKKKISANKSIMFTLENDYPDGFTKRDVGKAGPSTLRKSDVIFNWAFDSGILMEIGKTIHKTNLYKLIPEWETTVDMMFVALSPNEQMEMDEYETLTPEQQKIQELRLQGVL